MGRLTVAQGASPGDARQRTPTSPSPFLPWPAAGGGRGLVRGEAWRAPFSQGSRPGLLSDTPAGSRLAAMWAGWVIELVAFRPEEISEVSPDYGLTTVICVNVLTPEVGYNFGSCFGSDGGGVFSLS